MCASIDMSDDIITPRFRAEGEKGMTVEQTEMEVGFVDFEKECGV